VWPSERKKKIEKTTSLSFLHSFLPFFPNRNKMKFTDDQLMSELGCPKVMGDGPLGVCVLTHMTEVQKDYPVYNEEEVRRGLYVAPKVYFSIRQIEGPSIRQEVSELISIIGRIDGDPETMMPPLTKPERLDLSTIRKANPARVAIFAIPYHASGGLDYFSLSSKDKPELLERLARKQLGDLNRERGTCFAFDESMDRCVHLAEVKRLRLARHMASGDNDLFGHWGVMIFPVIQIDCVLEPADDTEQLFTWEEYRVWTKKKQIVFSALSKVDVTDCSGNLAVLVRIVDFKRRSALIHVRKKPRLDGDSDEQEYEPVRPENDKETIVQYNYILGYSAPRPENPQGMSTNSLYVSNTGSIRNTCGGLGYISGSHSLSVHPRGNTIQGTERRINF